MQYMDELEEQIDSLVKNTLGIEVIKNFSRGILSAEIILPKDKFAKEITKTDIKFEIIIDSYSPTLYPVPRIFCLTPYCFPSLADGRDLFRELKNLGNFRNGELILKNLLVELMEFVKMNIPKVKQSLTIKGKKVLYARTVVLSDVNFLLFKKDKANKNSMILLFWSSFNNLEKVQKLSDNKTVILHWTSLDKLNDYSMNLSFENRNLFLNELMERVKNFGMVFDISKINKENEIEKIEKFTTDSKFRNFEKEKQNEIKTNNNNNELKEEKLDEEKEDDNKRDKIDINMNKNNLGENGNEISEKAQDKINNDISTKEEEKIDN